MVPYKPYFHFAILSATGNEISPQKMKVVRYNQLCFYVSGRLTEWTHSFSANVFFYSPSASSQPLLYLLVFIIN